MKQIQLLKDELDQARALLERLARSESESEQRNCVLALRTRLENLQKNIDPQAPSEAANGPQIQSEGDTCLISSLEGVMDLKQLKASKIETDSIVQASSEGIIIANCSGAGEKFNAAALKILGLTADQLAGRTPHPPSWRRVHEDGSPMADSETAVMTALRTHRPVRNRIMGVILPSGEEKWIKLNVVPFEIERERKAACSMSDITALVRANEDFKRIFTHSSDLVCISHVDGSFRRISPSFTKLLGWSEQHLLSHPFVDLIHPDDREATVDEVRKLARGIPTIHFENRVRTHAGEYRRFSWVCEPDPTTGLLYASGRDVTQQRIDDLRVREILSAIGDSAIIAFTDPRGKITEVNDNFCKISGYARDELIGQDHRLINSGAHPKAFMTDLWRTIKSGKTWTGDIENRRKDGEHYFVRTVIAPLRSATGEIENFISIRFDVSREKNLQKRLENSEKLLNQLINQSSSKIFLVDVDGTFHLTNVSLAQDFRTTPDEMVGKSVYDFFPKPLADQLVRETVEVLTNQIPMKREHTFDFGGNTRIELVQEFPVRNTETGKLLLAGIITDITEIRSAQHEIEATRKLLQGIIDASPSTIFVKDLSGHYLICNETLARMHGKRPKDLIGKTLYDFFPKSVADRMAVHDHTIIHAGQPKTFEELIPIDGKPTQHLVSLFPVRDLDGFLRGVGGIITDVQEARDVKEKYESELRAQKHFLDTVLKNLPNMVFVKDYNSEMRFKLCNQAAQNLLGLSEEQIIGKTDHDFLPGEKAQHLADKERQIFQARSVLHVKEEALETPNGRRWLETYKVPTYKDDGSPDLLIAISKDITEQRQLQENLELERIKSTHNAKLASLGEMSAGIAHEINNPLGIIVGTIPLLKKFKEDPAKFAAKIEAMAKASDRIARIVKGLKKFSRSSDGNVHRVENLKSIIDEARILTDAKARRHSIPIEVRIPDHLSICCDGVEIEQVIVNLINNAIDAVKEAEIRWVRIDAVEENDAIVLRVTDSGPGISKEIEAKLFQPFFTTKPVGEGTGLGLSITKGILDQHHASLSVNSGSANTCFEIRFKKTEQVRDAA